MAFDLCHKIEVEEAKLQEGDLFLHIQGEFSLCKEMFEISQNRHFIFPTTERSTKELPDGKKVVNFQFVQWRGL